MSYFSSLLTSTTSRYASFRRTLLSSSSEDDSAIDDPENSHVSCVLRAYYTEKGRPFPPWLGPDPRAVATTQQPQRSFVASAPSSLRGQNSNITGARNTGGGLGELWADKPAGEKPQDEQPGSLRRGLGQRPGMRGSDSGSRQHHSSQNGPMTVRQLPSQRAGSYQTTQNPYGQQQQLGQSSNTSLPSQSSAGGGGSVQERLKARLGSRSVATPSPPLSRDGAGGGGGGRPYVGAGSPWSSVDEGYGGGGGDAPGPRYDGSYGRGPPGQRQR